MNWNKAQELQQMIGRCPRVRLAYLPTPIEKSDRLAKQLGGIELYFKREDRTGIALGGSKGRQCEFRLGPGVEQNADTLITGGSLCPNNLSLQTAAAARMLGWEVYLVFRTSVDQKEIIYQGNRLLEWLMGSHMELHDVELSAQPTIMENLAEQLRAEGRTPYVTGLTDYYLGGIAYANCLLEICKQLKEANLEIDYLVLPSAGPTAAGLYLAASYLDVDFQILAVNSGYYEVPEVSHVTIDQITYIAKQTAERLQIDVQLDRSRVDTYTFEKKEVTEERVNVMRKVASLEGILLDPIYTGATMEVLFKYAREGKLKPGDKVLFMHTGGTASLFSYSEKILAAGKNKC